MEEGQWSSWCTSGTQQTSEPDDVKKRLARAEGAFGRTVFGQTFCWVPRWLLDLARQQVDGPQFVLFRRFNVLAEFEVGKKGTAGGPSSMTVEHLQPLLDHNKDSKLFFPHGRNSC